MSSVKLSEGDVFTIKWACTNLPYIDFDDGKNVSNRIFLNKQDVVTIIKEMQSFVDFYTEDFSAGRVNEMFRYEDV
jgi:hypothetical protein